MNTFELSNKPEASDAFPTPARNGLGSSVLLNNARWFTQIRWLVIFLFLLAGSLGLLIPETILSLGIIPPHTWPWVMAGILITANACFSLAARKFNNSSPSDYLEAYIWLQIIIDLTILTVLVHIIGSTMTFISFTYLFHIALACIFFPKRSSLLVTILASVMYLACISMELSGRLPSPGIFLTPEAARARPLFLTTITAASAVVIWFVLWYLISHLSEFVRKRDIQLDLLNNKLIKADNEKNKIMLQTTHDLKAPFSGIESNIQILRFQHWNDMTEPIRNIVERIEVRADTLRKRINDILILGELRSNLAEPVLSSPVNLQSIINPIIEDLAEKAEGKKLTVSVNIPPVSVISNEKQLKILFLNLISNAISYSYDGGTVEVSAKQEGNDTCISISDHGIGIKPEALPRIFDEYFRTKEASEFNKLSTGLGLSIVKEIAQTLKLQIRVESEINHGTVFKVIIPS